MANNELLRNKLQEVFGDERTVESCCGTNCQLCTTTISKEDREKGEFFLLPTRYEDCIVMVCVYCYDYVAKYVRAEGVTVVENGVKIFSSNKNGRWYFEAVSASGIGLAAWSVRDNELKGVEKDGRENQRNMERW